MRAGGPVGLEHRDHPRAECLRGAQGVADGAEPLAICGEGAQPRGAGRALARVRGIGPAVRQHWLGQRGIGREPEGLAGRGGILR